MAGLQDDLQPFIDYSNEPTPPYLGDAHVIRFELSENIEAGGDIYKYRGVALFKPTPGQHPYYLQAYGYTFPVWQHTAPESARPMVKIGVHIGRLPSVEALLEFGSLNLADGKWHTDREEVGDASFFDASPGGWQGLRFSGAGHNRVAIFHQGVLIPW